MNKIDILPDIDLQNSREYYGLYNSRDFYKGTSFKMSGEWIEGTHYFNDEYIVDFISFEGALLSCTRSHISTATTKPRLKKTEDGTIIGIEPSNHWNFVMAGSEGPEGKSWVPTVEDGKLKWVLTSGEPSEVPVTDLKGDPGEKGETGDTGKTGRAATIKLGTVTTGDPGSSVVIKNRGTETDAILDFVIPKGDTGSPGPSGRDGVDGRTGDKGDPGKNATIKIGTIKTGEAGSKVSITNSGTDTNVILNITIPKGDKGDKGSTGDYGPQGIQGVPGKDGETPEFKIVTTSSGIEKELYYKTPSESEWHNAGIVSNIPGKSVKLIRVWGRPGSLEDDRILWGYDGIPVSEWTTLCYLNELKGDTIENVDITDDGKITMEMSSGNLLTTEGDVLPRFVEGVTETIDWDQKANITLNKSNAPREWALNVKVPKGKPATVTVVSEVEKLAPDAQPYVTDLNPDTSDANLKFGIPQGEKGDPGDENIAIGCQDDFPNGAPDQDKIWYDPCDDALGGYSVVDFLYNAYLAAGGTLTQEAFITALDHLSMVTGLQIKFADSFEALGPATADKLGQLWLVPSSKTEPNNLFNEYVVIHSPDTVEDTYMWERWGNGEPDFDLDDYYTKYEIDEFKVSVPDKLYYSAQIVEVPGELEKDQIILELGYRQKDENGNFTITDVQNVFLPEATKTNAGFISIRDKNRIDSIEGLAKAQFLQGTGISFTTTEDSKLQISIALETLSKIDNSDSEVKRLETDKVPWTINEGSQSKDIVLPENSSLLSTSAESTYLLIALSNEDNTVNIGTINTKVLLNSSDRPQVNLPGGVKNLAYLEELNSVSTDLTNLTEALESLKTRVSTNETQISSLAQSKQDNLVSGTNIKTINGQSILGEGDLHITGDVTEAPEDGKLYLRQNGSWVVFDLEGLKTELKQYADSLMKWEEFLES